MRWIQLEYAPHFFIPDAIDGIIISHVFETEQNVNLEI